MNNKRGQFFLIVAVIIIVVIVSVITVSNYTSTKDEVKLYDLGQEIGIESQQVIDSGTYSGLNDDEMANLMENFAKNYVSYIEEDKNIYFIFGNKEQIHFLGYQDLIDENVCVKLNPIAPRRECYPAEFILNENIQETKTFSPPEGDTQIDDVVVRVGGGETTTSSAIDGDDSEGLPPTDYQFKLKRGENFYFVIWREIKGEKHVVTSDAQ
ncbi:MAG: hypothetical protein AABW47_04630 [Nanoarchaeota archaeon]